MKAGRDEVNNSTGRGLVVLKAAVVDTELEKLDLKLRTVHRASRMVSPMAYDAGGEAGAVVRDQARHSGELTGSDRHSSPAATDQD